MKFFSKRLLELVAPLFVVGGISSGNGEEVSGIIIPRDNEGIYLRNEEGQFEVEWTPETKVALMTNTRQFKSGLSEGKLKYAIHSSKEVVEFPLPAGPITGIKTTRGGKHLETTLKEVSEESWIDERGLSLYFGEAPQEEQLASHEDPRFIGLWNPTAKPRTLSINGQRYEVSLKKGGQATIPLYGVIGVEALKPFVNRATVIGKKEGEVIVAEEIRMTPIGDQAAHDDPNLPRYLFIGDSISGNYSQGLLEALEGKFNLHHPPTNCGPSSKGVNSIIDWLGAYEQPGRHWDVISFNHGHWDAGNDKTSYQSNLEKIIVELKKTGAKLIWVTTCPVPNGFEPAGPLDAKGKAPGRTSGVMEKYLNPWAAEVVGRHPEIVVCDQWQFVKDNEDNLYKNWWAGTNVHFGGEQADALGQYLAKAVLRVTEPGKLPKSQTSVGSKPNEVSFIPMFKKDFAYQSKKTYGLYSEEDAAVALPGE
ncbi:MAG: SGNH/GDSL hydrolase family protein [Verrucomicrobiota bacterium]